MLVQNIHKVCSQLFNIQSPSLIFKIIGYNFNTTPVPKSQKLNCPVDRLFRPSWSRISPFCTYSTKISPGEDHQTPYHIWYKSISPSNVTAKQSQKLTTKRWGGGRGGVGRGGVGGRVGSPSSKNFFLGGGGSPSSKNYFFRLEGYSNKPNS